MVTFFGILVAPLGIVSIGLIILQPVPVVVGAWCTPSLIGALAMLTMIALTPDEVVAMGLFLMLARREGQSLWDAFWLGGTLRDTGSEAVPVRADVISTGAMFRGVALSDVGRSVRFVDVLFGAWFIAAPWLLGGGTIAAFWNGVAIGIALILLSSPRGRVRVH